MTVWDESSCLREVAYSGWETPSDQSFVGTDEVAEWRDSVCLVVSKGGRSTTGGGSPYTHVPYKRWRYVQVTAKPSRTVPATVRTDERE